MISFTAAWTAMSGQRKCVRTRIGCPDSMLRAPISNVTPSRQMKPRSARNTLATRLSSNCLARSGFILSRECRSGSPRKRSRRIPRRDHPISSIAESTRSCRSRLSSSAGSCSPPRHVQHLWWPFARNPPSRSTLAKIDRVHRPRGMRNIGSFATISCARDHEVAAANWSEGRPAALTVRPMEVDPPSKWRTPLISS
jgi:hypothetical protein